MNTNRIFQIFLVEITYSFLLFIIMLFSRIKIQEYFSMLSGLSGQLQAAETSISSGEITQEALGVLNSISSMNNTILFFVFVFLPFALLIIYVVFQGLSYRLSYSDFKDSLNKDYFTRFIIVTFFYFLFLFLILRYLLPDYNSSEVFVSENALNNLLRGSFLTLAIIFIGFCLVVTYYALLKRNKNWVSTLSNSLDVIFNRPKIILFNLGIYLLGLFRFMLITALVLSYSLKETLFFSLNVNLILVVVFSLAIAAYKPYLVGAINK